MFGSRKIGRGSRVALASAMAYAAFTLFIARDVLATLGTRIASDPGDPVLNAAILEWNATRLPWAHDWFQFPIFYPTANALAFSEHLLGVSLVAAPAYWTTNNPLIAYNLAVVLSYPLCGLAMFALVLRLTRDSGAAFLSGLAYAFAPYRASHLPHIQVLTAYWAPIALLGLHEFIAAGPPSAGPALRVPGKTRPRLLWLALFGVCWLLQGAANGYLLIYFSVLVGLWVLWFLMAHNRWRDAAMVIGSIAVAAMPLVPILYRYLTVQRELGLSRNLGEIAAFGADIAAPLCAPATLTVWGRLRLACGPEGELFPGVALILTCLGGWLLSRRDPEVTAFVFPQRPAIRRVRHLLLVLGIAFLMIAASALIVGPWRFDLGVIRVSASTPAKPLSTALALLLVVTLLSGWFSRIIRRGSLVTFYLSAAAVCWVFSWGPFPRLFGAPVLYQAPFAWLLQLPGVAGLRVPARFWMMTVLCLSVLLGLIVARVLSGRSSRQRAILIASVAAGLLVDGLTTVPAAAVNRVTPPEAALADRAVLALPLGDLERDVASTLEAVNGRWVAVNGFSGYEPVYYEALRMLSRERNPALFEPFRSRGDLYVVVHEDDAEMTHLVEDQPGFERQVARQGERLYRLPRTDAKRQRPLLGQRLGAHAIDASCSPEAMPLATDGDITTHWVCGEQSKDDQITVDLAAVHPVGAIVHALGPRGSDVPRHLVVETSLDGREWHTAWTGSIAAAVLPAALDAPRETRAVIEFAPRPARYVRLRQTGRAGRNYWSIAELEVWTRVIS